MQVFPDFIGVIGVILILLTYLLLQTQKLASTDLLYSVGNLIGAGCILFSLLFRWNLSAALIEIFWMLISLAGIYKHLQSRRKAA